MNEEKKLGQEPAFPEFERDEAWRVPAYKSIPGMSKRFYAACMAMQGILAAPHTTREKSVQLIAEESFMMADELLKQENQ